ncbi:MAG: hypothetical protein ACM3X0_08735 [Bacteroidota bacterium]
MNRSLLVAALFAVALSACSKKDEAIAALPAPAVAPALPAADATPEQKPAEGATLNAMPEQKPVADSKPAN